MSKELLTEMDVAILRMPYLLAMEGEISRVQFYRRVQDLLDRIEGKDDPVGHYAFHRKIVRKTFLHLGWPTPEDVYVDRILKEASEDTVAVNEMIPPTDGWPWPSVVSYTGVAAKEKLYGKIWVQLEDGEIVSYTRDPVQEPGVKSGA